MKSLFNVFFGVICAFHKEVLCMCAWLLFKNIFLVIFWDVVAKHCWSCYTCFFFFGWLRCVCVFIFCFCVSKGFWNKWKTIVFETVKRECYESHDKFWYWFWIWVTFRVSQNPTSQRQAQRWANNKMTLISRASSRASQSQDDLNPKGKLNSKPKTRWP
jgi:hypothetical protein